MTPRTLVVGEGGFGRELWAWILHARQSTPEMAFLDDVPKSPRCLSLQDYVPDPRDRLFMGIADPETRRHLVDLLRSRGATPQQFPAFVHPTVVMTPTVRLGRGVILCPYSLVSTGAEISDFVHVNVFSSVGHDAKIYGFATLASHVDVCGHAEVGMMAQLGSGARVLPGIRVGERAVVGAGAVVGRHVAPHSGVAPRPLVTFKE